MSELKEAVIISAARTPVGKFLGSLKGFSATELGAIAVRESVKRAGIKAEDVDEVIMGCVIQAGLGQNPARQAALRGGLPPGAMLPICCRRRAKVIGWETASSSTR